MDKTTDSIVWQPAQPKLSRMWEFMQFVATSQQKKFNNYQQLHTWSITHLDLFWQSLVEFFQIKFSSSKYEVLNHYDQMLKAKWFSGASLNFAQQLLSRKDEHPALVSITEDGTKTVLTYQSLYQQVAYCVAGLKAVGIVSGDRVAAIMPNVASTIIAMLATTAIGAIWSSCSPDFGAQAIIDRLGQIKPKVLFTCNGHQYGGKEYDASTKIKEIVAAITSIQQVVICPVIQQKEPLHLSRAQQWDNFLQPAVSCDFKIMPFDHPIYILFSSGTTGKPKCIVHGAGGTLLQHIKELGLHTDLRAADNLCFYTTCGWMMWNWMVSALALGTTITLYEGSPVYPNTLRLFQLIEEESITVFGTSAKFLSNVQKTGTKPCANFSLPSLRCILSTGSPLLPKNYDFVYQHIKPTVQLSSISGGTDIVSCFALGNPMLPVYRGEIQCLGLGMAVEVFNAQGSSIVGEHGELVCTKPFPSMPLSFWNDPKQEAYKHAYFERFSNIWAHGDFAEITPHCGLIIYGRSDAVLNPGGVRIGTAEIYRQVEKIAEVVDSVVVGQNWQDDTRIVLFVKLKNGMKLDENMKEKIRHTIRGHASPRHVPAKIIQVADIPRTINGKIVEIAVRQIIHGQQVDNIESLANPTALDYFKNLEELTY